MKKVPVLFMRIAWMQNYRGVTKDDIPAGAGSHVEENKDGGEVYNFKPHRGKCYGYVRVAKGNRIDIGKIGGKPGHEAVDGITVIFFAKHPGAGGQYIVGWYKNATVYRSIQNLRRGARNWHTGYTTTSDDYQLIAEDDRVFEVPHAEKGNEGWTGQANVWYPASKGKKSFLKKVEAYIDNPSAWIDRTRRPKPPLTAFQKDAEIRKKVELAGMERVAEYYSKRGYDVSDVSTLNYGWDMEATKGQLTLLLEVKGLSGNFGEYQFEITPNELAKSKSNRRRFCFCVVSHALNAKKQRLDIFYDQGKHWKTVDGKELKIQEVKSARGVLKQD